MKILASILIAAALLLPLPEAAADDEERIAVVNLERAIYTTRVAEKRRRDLRKSEDYVSHKKRLDSLQEEGKEHVEKLRRDETMMSDEQKKEVQRKVNSISADIEHEVKQLQSLEEALNKELGEEFSPFVKEELDDLIKEEKIGILLQQMPQAPIVLYSDSDFDLTSKLTDALNRRSKKK